MSYLNIRYKNNKKVHYDEVFSDFLVSKIFEENLGRKPDTLTEVGVGTGKLAEKFIQRHDIKVRGVDIERYPHLHKAVEFHKASVEQIGGVAIQQSDVFFSKSVIEPRSDRFKCNWDSSDQAPMQDLHRLRPPQRPPGGAAATG